VKPAPANGEIGRGRNSSDNERANEHGNSASYLVRRLKRDRPDVATKLARGEYTSARAAAVRGLRQQRAVFVRRGCVS
jgi:hypothetical protein